MHSGRNYRLKEFLLWTRRDIYWLLLLATIPTILFKLMDWKWMAIPWVPVALIGTAAAFIAGFKNNATYARAWEARQIWGAIVNSSRTWGIVVKDFVKPGAGSDAHSLHRTLIYRHIAWLTALRFQLRESRVWENVKTKSYNSEYKNMYSVQEWESNLADELKPFLSDEERDYILSKKNRATQIIGLQSGHLAGLAKEGLVDPLYHIEMETC